MVGDIVRDFVGYLFAMILIAVFAHLLSEWIALCFVGIFR
jgi:hypothetical protein